MRRSTILSLSCLLALVGGCEDGPTQVYNPSPPGAGGNWNNGGTPGWSDPAQAPFQNTQGGTNAQEICNGMQLAARWAQMVLEPISPPTQAGGLDLSGGDTWNGLTIQAAEQVNCQSTNLGDAFGDGEQVNYWGDNGELWAHYLISNRKIDFMTVWPGYIGPMKFHDFANTNNYTIIVQSQIQKNGKPFILDWTGAGGANFVQPADELYRALIATYAPALPAPPANVTCFDTGRCIKGSFGDVAYFYIPAIGFAIWIDNQNAAQPTPSIPTRLDVDLTKLLAFAFVSPQLKLDAEGPVANGGILGHATKPCDMKLGQTYGDFLSSCVQVTGDPKADQTELNKLIGDISHSDERFAFDITGVDMEFTDNELPADDIIHDKDRPTPLDYSTEFLMDQSTVGDLQNDFDANGNKDFHGTGAVYKEFQRLARSELLAVAGVADGNPANCLAPVPLPQNWDESAFIASLPPYCTGLEGFVSPAPPTQNGDPNNLGPANALKVNPQLTLGLKLGHQKVSYCWDANGDVVKGYKACTSGDTFSTSFARALKVFGRGRIANMPTNVQDVRFFFRQWVNAFIKYLTVGAQDPVPDLSGIVLNPDDLFFDSDGSGQFERGEYVDRRFVTQTQTPTDLLIIADVRNGIFDLYAFSSTLYRGEKALYTSVRENPNDAVGKEDTALLTNLFGSPVLKNGWHDSTKGKSAYYCATTLDPNNCDGQIPPLDQNGNLLLDEINRPLLSQYPGAFSHTVFQLGDTNVKILQTYDNIQSAMVQVPLYTNPYDPKSTLLTPIKVLVPWVPKQPGEGFPVAVSGVLDKFITASVVDFSGTTISANVDYDVQIDPMTGLPVKGGAITFKAVETTDFLGRVFVCQDPATGDLLNVRMYSPVADLLDWLDAHPGAYQACDMIIRYSPFNNFPDFITSLQSGVRLSITQGGGFGRVVDVTLFVPGQ